MGIGLDIQGGLFFQCALPSWLNDFKIILPFHVILECTSTDTKHY